MTHPLLMKPWVGLGDELNAHVDRLGATPLADGSTSFRVWAPRHWGIEAEVETPDGGRRVVGLQRDGAGCYGGVAQDTPPGSRYRYRLPDGAAYPDPCSRRQPEGVHGPSEVVVPGVNYPWRCNDWRGVAKRDLVIYELHVGCFTRQGSFEAIIDRLPQLVELGVAAIELMPLAEAPGRWNWGYDGVGLYAVNHNYGSPDDLRRLVDACHAAGLGVLLDVVYNHVGPEGNYLDRFGPYFTSQRQTPWGGALNFDGRRSAGVRRHFVENALYWLDEYRLDGLRLDAAHFMFDDSEPSILDEVRIATAEYAERCGRTIHLIAETNAHDAQLLTPNEHRPALDGLWSDCLMHSFYSIGAPDHRGTPRGYHGASDLVASLRHGFVYHGPSFERQSPEELIKLGRADDGRPFLESFVTGLQTHDAVGNHPHGLRLHQLASLDFQRAAAALLLLHPSVPLLFMGEEEAVDTPFLFFADFGEEELRRAVDRGRRREHPQHEWRGAPRPSSPEAFHASNLDTASRRDAETRDWYRRLLTLRRQGIGEAWLDHAHLSVDHDESKDLFRMAYRLPGGGELSVYARLTAPQTAPSDVAVLSIAGDMLLASDGDIALASGKASLGPNRAIVVRKG